MQEQLVLLDRYEVDESPREVIGSGGMALVHPGFDLRLERDVAVKTPKPQYQGNPGVRSRFRREAEALAAISHPRIVRLYDVVDDNRGSFIIMERLVGQSLADVLSDEGPLDVEFINAILQQVASALEAMHSQGWVHLDIKPGNLMLLEDESVKLMDFGLARQIHAPQPSIKEITFGTAATMSPEQAAGKDLTPASDIYSLGCTVFELVTGRSVFIAEGEGAKETMRDAHLNDDPDLPSAIRPELHLPAWVDKVIGYALEKDPKDRYPTATAFADAFDDELHGRAMTPVYTEPAQTTAIGHTAVQPAARPTPSPSFSGIRMESSSPQLGAVAEPPIAHSAKAPRQPNFVSRRVRRFGRNVARMMIVFLILMVGLVTLQGGPTDLIHSLVDIAPGMTTTVTAPYNLRTGPSQSAGLITTVPEGTSARITGMPRASEDRVWWPVRVEVEGVRTNGWMAGDGLETTDAMRALSTTRSIVDLPGRIADWLPFLIVPLPQS